MKKEITIKNLINNIDDYIIIDLRSPVEYQKGFIKGALNIPLLNNEMRQLIGTIYKEDKEKAYQKGYEVFKKRSPEIYKEILKLDKSDKKILFYCFRGGKRSSSIVELMNKLGVESFKLINGYKGYRKYILQNIDSLIEKLSYLVVSGNTGSGKTIVLNKLKEDNYPVIDLEGLANHRGSVFGSLGLTNQINQRNFEDLLFYEIKKHINKGSNQIFIESESRKIGKVSLPNKLVKKMKDSKHIVLDVSIDKRIEIIDETYHLENIDNFNIEDIILNNNYFKENLGKKWVEDVINLIKKADYKSFIKIMLIDYYDKLYKKSIKNYDYKSTIKSDDLEEIVEKLKEVYDR